MLKTSQDKPKGEVKNNTKTQHSSLNKLLLSQRSPQDLVMACTAWNDAIAEYSSYPFLREYFMPFMPSESDLEAAYNKMLEGDPAAVPVFIRAAIAGNAIAQHNLAYCYERGLVENHVNRKAAVQLYSLAAQSGLSCSIFSLGIAYETGLGGLTPDLNKAQEMYALVKNESSNSQYRDKARLRLNGIITGLNEIGVIKELTEDKAFERLFQHENAGELLKIAVINDDIEFIRKVYTTDNDHVKGMYSEQLKNQCSQYIDSLTTAMGLLKTAIDQENTDAITELWQPHFEKHLILWSVVEGNAELNMRMNFVDYAASCEKWRAFETLSDIGAEQICGAVCYAFTKNEKIPRYFPTQHPRNNYFNPHFTIEKYLSLIQQQQQAKTTARASGHSSLFKAAQNNDQRNPGDTTESTSNKKNGPAMCGGH